MRPYWRVSIVLAVDGRLQRKCLACRNDDCWTLCMHVLIAPFNNKLTSVGDHDPRTTSTFRLVSDPLVFPRKQILLQHGFAFRFFFVSVINYRNLSARFLSWPIALCCASITILYTFRFFTFWVDLMKIPRCLCASLHTTPGLHASMTYLIVDLAIFIAIHQSWLIN